MGRPRHLRLHYSEAERGYLKRALEYYPDKLARYRQTCKVHKVKKGNKNPPVRPIIWCAGTFMNCWSKWLDHWLQQLKQFIPLFVKDGDQVLQQILNRLLPAHVLLFVTDDNAMYNNIDTDHTIP